MPSKRRLIRMLATLFLALGIALLQRSGYVQRIGLVAEESQPGLYRVTNFIDGDTISVDMDGRSEKVRLIGVDTPETHDPRKAVQCFGQSAAAFTRNFIGVNRVRLERDPQTTNRDRYDRLLRYVYLQSGQLVNAEIIKQGYGFAYVYFPFNKMEEFKRYQVTAEKQGLGLWSKCQTQTNQSGQSSTN